MEFVSVKAARAKQNRLDALVQAYINGKSPGGPVAQHVRDFLEQARNHQYQVYSTNKEHVLIK